MQKNAKIVFTRLSETVVIQKFASRWQSISTVLHLPTSNQTKVADSLLSKEDVIITL